MYYTPMRQTGKKERAVGSINIKEVESKGLGDKLYVGEGEGGLKEDAQVSARVWTPRWGRRPGSRHRWHRTRPREGISTGLASLWLNYQRGNGVSPNASDGGSHRRTLIHWLGPHTHCYVQVGWIY